jgi:hypothetical protein
MDPVTDPNLETLRAIILRLDRLIRRADDELATADPAQVIRLLRPCMLSLAASPGHDGRP